jgi:hypothetical protein
VSGNDRAEHHKFITSVREPFEVAWIAYEPHYPEESFHQNGFKEPNEKRLRVDVEDCLYLERFLHFALNPAFKNNESNKGHQGDVEIRGL